MPLRKDINLTSQIIQNVDLFILRHGEAKPSDGNDDFVRPLTATGTTDVTLVAEWLKGIGVNFDAIITSPLKRAYQSASIVSKIFNIENNLMNWDELRPEGNRMELHQKLSPEQLFKQESVVLVVGHEPYLSTLISEIISDGSASSHVVIKKAGLAKIRITSQSAQTIHGELEWLLTPNLMKNISK